VNSANTEQGLPGPFTVLIGISGSGKSTFARRYPATWSVSLDAYRKLCADSAAAQNATTPAVGIQALVLDARLARRLPTLVDDTNVEQPIRAALVARARYWAQPACALLFDVPLDIALSRNATRERPVPEHVVAAQHEQLPAVQELMDEGFAIVHRASSARLAGRHAC
jgi:predicted kinase